MLGINLSLSLDSLLTLTLGKPFYDLSLVALSIVIAIFTAYMAFLMEHYAEPMLNQKVRYVLLGLSGLVMGVGSRSRSHCPNFSAINHPTGGR
jgi:predicted membrane protein